MNVLFKIIPWKVFLKFEEVVEYLYYTQFLQENRNSIWGYGYMEQKENFK